MRQSCHKAPAERQADDEKTLIAKGARGVDCCNCGVDAGAAWQAAACGPAASPVQRAKAPAAAPSLLDQDAPTALTHGSPLSAPSPVAAEQRQQRLGLVGVIPIPLSQPDMASPRSPRPPPHAQPAAAAASVAAAPAAPAPPAPNQPKQRPNQPKQRSNQPKQRPNQPKQRSNQPKQRSNQPKQRSNQPKQRSNQPKQRSNQPKRFVATTRTRCPDNPHAEGLARLAAQKQLFEELLAAGFQEYTNISAPCIKRFLSQVKDLKLIQKADGRAVLKGTWNGRTVAVKILSSAELFDLRRAMEAQQKAQQQQQQQRPQGSGPSSAAAAAVAEAPSRPKLSPEAVAAAAKVFRTPAGKALAQEARCTELVYSAVAASCPSNKDHIMRPIAWHAALVPAPPESTEPWGVWRARVVIITPWAEGGSLTDRLDELLKDAINGSPYDWCCGLHLKLQSVGVLKTFRTAGAITGDFKDPNLVVVKAHGGAGGQPLEVVSAIDLDGAQLLAGPEVDILRALEAGPDPQLRQVATKLLQLLPLEVDMLTEYFAAPEMLVGLYGRALMRAAGMDQAAWEGLLAQVRPRGKGMVRLAELARAGRLTPGGAPSLFKCGGKSHVCGASMVFLLGANIEYWVLGVLSGLRAAGRPLTAQDVAAVHGLGELAERCMAALPEDRPSLEEVEAELQRLAQQQLALDVQEEELVRAVVWQQQVVDLQAARQHARDVLLQHQQLLLQQPQLQAAWQHAQQALLLQLQQLQQLELQLQAALLQQWAAAQHLQLQQQQEQLQLQAALLQAQILIQLQAMGMPPP